MCAAQRPNMPMPIPPANSSSPSSPHPRELLIRRLFRLQIQILPVEEAEESLHHPLAQAPLPPPLPSPPPRLLLLALALALV